MKIFDNTKGVKDNFKVGDIVKSQDGHVFMIASDPDYKYNLVSLGDGSMSDSCNSIGDLFEEGYLDETDKKVSGFLTVSDFF
ncbi:hypothetical protein SAC12B_0023 [Lactobacillus phage SAC12B]|uniref:Uncharacterized protein n=1 Tax=Lactobacillus phage SAC12B TaxID=2510941 RepID=A0A4Y5FFD9_9CAUD|nr:hypothetical protein HWC10_gp023 [Lactobacillus phage SAC12B]QBJ03812.1 hypothetical protein SAC12B_0023 [Lactobacillus phage SAC12B]